MQLLAEFLVDKSEDKQVLCEGMNVFCHAQSCQYVIWHFKNHIPDNPTRRNGADELGYPLKSPSLRLFDLWGRNNTAWNKQQRFLVSKNPTALDQKHLIKATVPLWSKHLQTSAVSGWTVFKGWRMHKVKWGLACWSKAVPVCPPQGGY